jgi:hypothetical protein
MKPRLCGGNTLVSSKPVPLYSFCVILKNALAVLVHETETGLCGGNTLVSSKPVPLYSFCVVLRNA